MLEFLAQVPVTVIRGLDLIICSHLLRVYKLYVEFVRTIMHVD